MGEKLTPEDFGSFIAPEEAPDYENMPWTEVATRGAKNLPSSFVRSAGDLIEAVKHPIDTAKAIGDVGYGFGSMAYGALGGEQDPVAKAENERLARAVAEPYTSVAGFKKELAENPVGPLSMAVPGVGGTLVKGGELLGKAGAVGSTMSKLGRGIEIAGAAVDPARAVLETGRAVKTVSPRAATILQSITTGTPEVAFEKAFDAAAERGIDAKPIREGFNQFFRGRGDVIALSQDIESAVDTIRSNASRDWIATRGQVTGASTTPINYSGVNSAFADAWKNYGGHPRGKTSAFPSERAALLDAAKLVREYTRSPFGTGKNTLEGLDELKRALWARSQETSGGAADAYKKIHASVRQTLENTSPEYAKLMDEYQAFLDEMQTIKKTMGAGQNVDANIQLARAIRAFRTPGGVSMMERVASVDPTIPYKVAGAALNQNSVGLRQVIAGSATVGTQMAAALASGDPVQIAKIVPLFAAGVALSSPKLMGKANYGAGRVAAGIGALGDIPLGPVDLGDVVSAGVKSAYPAGVAAEQIAAAKDRMGLTGEGGLLLGDGSELNIREPGQASGGRVQRKSGGRVKSNPISAEVKRVRALLSHKTASMLSMPDDAVATALHLAKG